VSISGTWAPDERPGKGARIRAADHADGRSRGLIALRERRARFNDFSTFLAHQGGMDGGEQTA
jgi:hypothetical protein